MFGGEWLMILAVLGPIDHLTFLIQILHPFLRE